MKILKISESVYTASFSHVHASYIDGFPQREKQLLSGMPGLEIHWFQHPLLDNVAAINQSRTELDRYIERQGIDYILFDNPISALIIKDSLWSRTVFDCCDWYLDYYLCEFGRDEGYDRLEFALNIVFARCRLAIFQSTTIEAWFRKGASQPGVHSIVLPNGYNPDIFYRGPSPIRFDQPTALFVGKLGRWYQGLKTIARGLPAGWQLLLVGDGPCRDEYRDLAGVQCTGRLPLSDIGNYVRAADVCVFPVDDCSPIATSEYLACGRPVVHRGDKIAWTIQDGVNGYLVADEATNWREKILEAAGAGPDLLDRAANTPKTWNALQAELREWLEGIR